MLLPNTQNQRDHQMYLFNLPFLVLDDNTRICKIAHIQYRHDPQRIYRWNLFLAHSTWARWWWSWSPQVGEPFLTELAWWRLTNCSPILHYGKASFRHIFTWSFSSCTPQALSIWSLREGSSWTWLLNPESSLIKMMSWRWPWGNHYIVFFKTC